jgi:hypothetical protein
MMFMEAARTSETSVDNYFTRQYISEDNSEQVRKCTLSITALTPTVLLHYHLRKILTTVLISDNAIYFHEKCNDLCITTNLTMVR